MKLSVYIAASLDGYIATPDHGIEWLNSLPNPDGSDFGYSEFMASIDALIMGRNTFDVVSGFDFWPYEKPVFVLSNSLSKVPEKLADKVKIVSGDLAEILKELDRDGYHNIYIDGGKVITSFLNHDLVDEMIITRIPILLGDGIPLFGSLENMMKWKHIKTESFSNSCVKSTYIRER